MSVCPALGSHLTDFHEIRYLKIFRKYVHKIQVQLKSHKNNTYFTWRPIYIYDNITLNSSENEICFRQKLYRKSKHVLFPVTFFSEYRADYEIMWKNTAERDRSQMTIWRMRIACWNPECTNTLSYVVFTSFPQQQWLHKRPSVLCYMQSACRVN